VTEPPRRVRPVRGRPAVTMPLIRITSGGVRPSGDPSGRRARRLLGLGLVDLRAGTISRVWPWQSLANCQNTGGKIVCMR
jgi:hypothetical protein